MNTNSSRSSQRPINEPTYGIESSSKANEKLKKECKAFPKENETLRKANEVIKAENQSLKAEHEKMVLEKDSIKKEVLTMQQEAKITAKEVRAMAKNQKAIKKENTIIKKENTLMRKENMALKKENVTIRGENRSLRNENNSIKSENNSIKSENNHFCQVITTLQLEITRHKKSEEQLQVACLYESMPIEDLELSPITITRLDNAGIHTVGNLLLFPASALLRVSGMSLPIVQEVEKALIRYGMTLPDTEVLPF